MSTFDLTTKPHPFLDSHCHLEDEAFALDLDEVYATSIFEDVPVIILAGSDLETSKRIIDLTKRFDGIYGVLGVHPHEAEKVSKNYLDELSELLKEPKILGIGEIGLDYYYDHSPRDLQRKIFCEQLELAETLNLPIVIHSRDASLETLDILKKRGYHNGVFHCYSYSVETLREVLSLGYYISLGGAVTFKNAKKPVAVAAEVPLERLLLETDAPYMTPVPFRGKRNEPKHVKIVAEKIALIKDIPLLEVAKVTWENTEKLFRMKFK